MMFDGHEVVKTDKDGEYFLDLTEGKVYKCDINYKGESVNPVCIAVFDSGNDELQRVGIIPVKIYRICKDILAEKKKNIDSIAKEVEADGSK